MKIIDSHFHLWDLEQNYYPWLSDRSRPTLVQNAAALPGRYLPADLLRDAGSLELVAAVHVQAEHDHADPVRETRWLQGIAGLPGSRGIPQAIVAELDFSRADARRLLQEHCAFPNVRGIRYVLHRRLNEAPPYDPLLDPAWTQGFAMLRDFGLSFDMQLFPAQHEAGVALCRAHPDIPVVLTHAGMPIDQSETGLALWRRSIRAFAACPNVSIKISGFGVLGRAWDARTVQPFVAQVLDAFTPARCMLASNYPVEGLLMPYRAIWAAFDELFAAHTPDEREQLMWRNAARVYRIDCAASASLA